MFKKNQTIAISAGGTGGHIFPALAVAKSLLKEGYKVIFFTSKNFYKYVRVDDIKIDGLVIVQLSCHNASRWKQFFMILRDLWTCRIISTRKVCLCIGFGGLVSFPPLLYGILTRKKCIIHEQNAVLGLANRLLLPFVRLCLLTFEETKKIPTAFKHKIVVVGNPVRQEIKDLVFNFDNPSVNYKAFFSLDDNINLSIIGGSQASKAFDEIVPLSISQLPDDIKQKLFVSHQCKEANVMIVKNIYNSANVKNDVRPFFFNIGELMRSSHLIIARSGATSIAEIASLGIPSILIPLPTATDDHQFENAKILRDIGGTIVLEQGILKPNILSKTLEDLFRKESSLFEMCKNTRKISQKYFYADTKICMIINKLLRGDDNFNIQIDTQDPSYIADNRGLG